MQSVAAVVENSTESPPKIKNRITLPCGSHTTENENSRSKGYSQPYFYSSIICNSQDAAETQVPISRWMDKEGVYVIIYVCVYNGMLLGHKTEGSLAICNNMDGSGRYNDKGNKSEKGKYHTMTHVCET